VIATTLVILGGNGDTTPPVMAPIQMPVATPTVPQMPSPPMPPSTPDPPAPPAPAPRPTADGNYVCVEGTIVSDVDGHEFIIALLRALRNFVVQEGSISIRHPAPFVDIVNAQFNKETGDFLGTAVGRVAGSPTVGVRAQGNVNTSTGRMVFEYTMGTGGELPGGRPVIYRLTLQKQ
jgi:hypothetical protein